MFSKTALFAALLSPTLAAVHEQLAALPLGWSEVATPSDGQILTLSIGLAQQNIDQLESKLLAVSTPGNAEYGQHLDVDDVNSLFAPTEEANTAVQSWLTNAGVSQVQSDGHWVTFATTVSKANELLNTTFKTYSNSGVQKIRTTQYSVPDDIVSYVDLSKWFNSSLNTICCQEVVVEPWFSWHKPAHSRNTPHPPLKCLTLTTISHANHVFGKDRCQHAEIS